MKMTEYYYYRVPIYMSNPKYDEISSYIRNGFPNSCILFIDEVNNDELRKKYEEQLERIKTLRGEDKVKEQLLFHGTRAENIDSIGCYGFDTKKNTTSAHGRGTYFAKNASYSNEYMRTTDKKGISYMFLAEVIVGECTKVSSGSLIDIKKYDNSVNILSNPTIYVTPYDYGAYPKYIIAFHKNAPK